MTSSVPEVSVIVPTYNRAPLIAETLNSILPQLDGDDELIVVDDGSEDDTRAALSAFGAQIQIVRQDNAGKSAALNNGLAHCSGAYVWIVDDDDLVASDARQKLIEPLRNDPETGFSYGRHDRFSVDEYTGAVRKFPTGYWVDCEPDAFLVHTLEDMFPHQPGMMVRKSLYDDVGPFSSKYDRWEDYEMLIRLAMSAKPAAVSGILFHQRLHSGTRGSKENPIAAAQRNANWIELGKRLSEEVIAPLPLELFLPERNVHSPGDERRAIIQRGAIYARHHLWHDAIDEFRTALSMELGALTEGECAILIRSTQSKFGIEDLLNDRSVQSSLQELAKRNFEGRQLCRTIGQSLKWRLRAALQSAQFLTSRKLALVFGRLATA